jgi:hypothetical protein
MLQWQQHSLSCIAATHNHATASKCQLVNSLELLSFVVVKPTGGELDYASRTSLLPLQRPPPKPLPSQAAAVASKQLCHNTEQYVSGGLTL